MGAKPDSLLKAGARVRLLRVAKEAAIKKKPVNYHLKLWSVTSWKPRKADTNNLTVIGPMIFPIFKTGLRK